MGMTAEELIDELPKGLIKWQQFKAGKKALYITADTDLDRALFSALSESGLAAWQVSASEIGKAEKTKYHYAVVSSAIERAGGESAVRELLCRLRAVLEEDGKLLVLTENRFAVRYFCGDQDPYTGRSFDGVEDYKRVRSVGTDAVQGRLYARAELSCMLEDAGFVEHRFYSVFPELICPQILVSEAYMPAEELKIRIFPQYHNPDTVFLEEENLYTSLMRNGLFHTMANGFLIECPLDGRYENAKQITLSMERGRENALCTIIRQDGKVEKRPVYEEGKDKAKKLKENTDDLTRHGVRMIEAEVTGNAFVMPYVEGEPLVSYFRRLAEKDRWTFYEEFDRLWELLLASSEHVPYEEVAWERFDPWWDEEKDEKKRAKIDRNKWRDIAFAKGKEKEPIGPVLKRGYMDLVLLNGFRVEDDFVFYDQEMYMAQVPAKAILYRNINFLYHGDAEMERVFPRDELMEHYGVKEYQDLFYAYESFFLNRLRNDRTLKMYHRSRRRNTEVVHSNRQRMNFSTEAYLRLFVHIFGNLENKKLYLFGSGMYTKKFLAMYGKECEIEGILDNDKTKWNSVMEGVKILSPAVLDNLDSSTYKVIICIKNYTTVLKQLQKQGVSNIGIYDTNMEYPRNLRSVEADKADLSKGSAGQTGKKKYHVGYVAGVFDLFHMGHLNLLRRAKEQCDYLIAGVVTDAGVQRDKRTQSFIPFAERLALVQACRYVDQAVEIPLAYNDTKDAYLKYQFDVQFSGSDYASDPDWLEKQAFLRKHGAELVFFPYTESTSSTRIKEMIEKKLL